MNGTTLVGALYLGNNNATTADVLDLIRDVPAMGLVDGGVITYSGTPLTIAISSGFGYLMTGVYPTEILKRLNWVNSTLLLTADTTNYIYYDTNGVLNANSSKPNTVQNIYLGRVRTTSVAGPVGGVEFIDASPVSSQHMDNGFDNYNRNVFGSIFVSGSIVTSTASSPYQLAISGGQYYYSNDMFSPSGQSSPASWDAYYHNSPTTFTFISQSAVDNTQYDNGTGLVAITPGDYVKHSLYLIGDGANERYMLVYAQAEYTTLSDAQGAPLADTTNLLLRRCGDHR